MVKPKLSLVSSKEMKKQFEMFYVFLDDGQIMEFDMKNCVIWDGDEIIEVAQKDERDVFNKRFIIRMRFVRSKRDVNDPLMAENGLKPVA